jgi:hypothetical protein
LPCDKYFAATARVIVTTGWSLAVTDISQVYDAATAARMAADEAGLDPGEAARCELVATELATNLVKHARQGRLVCNAAGPLGRVQLLAIDHGPGTDGRLDGPGLELCRRAATDFCVYSVPGQGTVVWADIGPAVRKSGTETVTIGGLVTPSPGESTVGDGWGVLRVGTRLTIGIVDGAGRGVAAGQPRRVALTALEHHIDSSGLLAELAGRLPITRGAAAVVEIGLAGGAATVNFTGVGNIAARMGRPERPRALVAGSAVAAGPHSRPHVTGPVAWAAPGLLVLTTDGVGSWDLARYPQIEEQPPAICAALIWRDACPGNDDATVVVAALAPGPGLPAAGPASRRQAVRCR